jgi:MFS family permease
MDNYVLIMAPAIILAAVFTAFYGRIYDKYRFKAAVIPAVSLLMSGYVILYFFRNTALVFIGSLLMMCGYLSGMAVFGAMVRDNTPQDRAGMFQGLRIFSQVFIPGIVGPYIGAAVLRNAETIVNDDGTSSFVPNENIFLAAFVAAVVLWLVLIPVFRMIRKEKDHAA